MSCSPILPAPCTLGPIISEQILRQHEDGSSFLWWEICRQAHWNACSHNFDWGVSSVLSVDAVWDHKQNVVPQGQTPVPTKDLVMYEARPIVQNEIN